MNFVQQCDLVEYRCCIIIHITLLQIITSILLKIIETVHYFKFTKYSPITRTFTGAGTNLIPCII